MFMKGMSELRIGDNLNKNLIRAVRVALLTFTISLLISLIFQFSLAWWVALTLLLVVVFAGIIFDIVGTAVTAATEAPFHAMGADKVSGARQAVYLIRNADRVANFCNDVVGDISGTMSGAIVASIVLQFSKGITVLSQDWLNSLAIALLAALTVGGKALGKSFAIERSHQIVHLAGRILAFFNYHPGKGKGKNRSGLRKGKKT